VVVEDMAVEVALGDACIGALSAVVGLLTGVGAVVDFEGGGGSEWG